jgi:hypothetical protein
MHLLPTENPWHHATNFLVSSVDKPQGICSRYDKITNEMQKTGGRLTLDSAFELLADVTQINTQWSVLYQMSSGKIDVAMGKNFDQDYQFQLIP